MSAVSQPKPSSAQNPASDRSAEHSPPTQPWPQPIVGSRKIYVPAAAPICACRSAELSCPPPTARRHAAQCAGRSVRHQRSLQRSAGPYRSARRPARPPSPVGAGARRCRRVRRPQRAAFDNGRRAADGKSGRAADSERFTATRRPLRAKAGRNVTQLHYARSGRVTPRWNTSPCARACPSS